jgi:succinyl-CoA synthetase beta subunit
MKLHEYQGKEVLKQYGIPVSDGLVAHNLDEVMAGYRNLYPTDSPDNVYVVKAQVHAGGRGKGGGVKIGKGVEALREKASQIIGMTLITPQTGPEGVHVHKVLVTADAFYPGTIQPKEFYFAITLDRAVSKDMIMASSEGGMDIEEVAEKHPEKIVRWHVDPKFGLQAWEAREIALALGFTGAGFKSAVDFMLKLYKCYVEADASMVEINPMLLTSDEKVIALDCKFDIDDNAMYRQQKWAHFEDTSEDSPLEVEAHEHNLNYVKLDGNVGCMVNGAGLAMATMDIIKLSGGEPANFLDVGGGANAQTVEAGFRIILKDPAVKAILINVFGGIVQCDRVANGVVEAYKKIGSIPVPVIVRLQGTNAEIAKEIIDKSGLKVIGAVELREAALAVKEALATVNN